MSDEEIRELLDLGVEDLELGHPIEAGASWAAGRRIRTRRSWGVGLGAVAAAATIVGVVWSQGLTGGEVQTPPPAEGTLTGPTVLGTPTETETTTAEDPAEARGEPFLAQFERAGDEAPSQLSGASEPATLEDLQGRWIGPDGAEFSFAGDRLRVTASDCRGGEGSVEIAPDGRLVLLDQEGWELDCTAGQGVGTDWQTALRQQPLLSLDGARLLISGLDGTSEESRVPASLTLRAADEAGLIWEDGEPQGEDTRQQEAGFLALGEDFQLMVSGDVEDRTLHSISDLNLESPGLCGQVLVSSLRSDGVLLAGAPEPWPVCTEGQDALPPAEPSPAVVALLRSGPTVSFEGSTMTISGTVPQSLLEVPGTPPPDDASTTREPREEEGAQEPPASTDPPEPAGVPQVALLSEGEWAPTGELTPLTTEEATGRRWLPVSTLSGSPEVGTDPDGDRGLSFDGSSWGIRDCGVDITVAGGIEDGVLVTTGEPEVVPDPDPGASCTGPLMSEHWSSILTGEPRVSTDGQILVISGATGQTPVEPAGLALAPEGLQAPQGGPTTVVTAEDLAAGLQEVPGDTAAQDVGVSDVRDPQPEHATTLSLEDGVVTIDVGCAAPLQGPAWFSHVGPAEVNWQLTAALPDVPECDGAAAQDAELWRQMLGQGAFLHHFGDYVIVDSGADPALGADDSR